jgi:DNA repair exonuclease SbcCD nuclease subunit
MRIAIISDTHLGYARFEEDAFVQAERAFLAASESADAILFAGDVFDTKIPKLETLDRAIAMLKKVKIPVFAIHGNHERRAKELINPARLLSTSGVMTYLHGEAVPFNSNGEKLQILGIGNIPDEYADEAIKKVIAERFVPEKGAFRILLIHQSIRELMPHGKNELSLEYLETLPFDLIVNGHLHGKDVLMKGRFLIPGSTVITQLKKEETAGKGFFMFDTATKKADFVPIDSRPFFCEDIVLKGASAAEAREIVKNKIEELMKKGKNAIVCLKVSGTLKDNVQPDLRFPEYEHVFVDSALDAKSLKERLERIRDARTDQLSVRDLALRQLVEKVKGKITAFDAAEIFEKLVEGPDEALEYIKREDAHGKAPAGP